MPFDFAFYPVLPCLEELNISEGVRLCGMKSQVKNDIYPLPELVGRTERFPTVGVIL